MPTKTPKALCRPRHGAPSAAALRARSPPQPPPAAVLLLCLAGCKRITVCQVTNRINHHTRGTLAGRGRPRSPAPAPPPGGLHACKGRGEGMGQDRFMIADHAYRFPCAPCSGSKPMHKGAWAEVGSPCVQRQSAPGEPAARAAAAASSRKRSATDMSSGVVTWQERGQEWGQERAVSGAAAPSRGRFFSANSSGPRGPTLRWCRLHCSPFPQLQPTLASHIQPQPRGF